MNVVPINNRSSQRFTPKPGTSQREFVASRIFKRLYQGSFFISGVMIAVFGLQVN
jgi:hypothetical protein